MTIERTVKYTLTDKAIESCVEGHLTFDREYLFDLVSHLAVEVQESRKRIAELEGKLAAIAAIHHHDDDDRYGHICAACCDEMPCPTLAIIGGAS